MKTFLRAHHWQIFLFVIAIPWLTAWSLEHTGALPTAAAMLIPAILAFALVAWFWAAGTFLNLVAQPGFRMGTMMFHVSLSYPLIFAFVALIIPAGAYPSPEALLALVVVRLVFHVYLVSFVAKALATVELERPVTFRNYSNPFVLLLFFPVGIWFIQPRINRLYEASLPRDAEPQLQS